jgi:hypothetical protein
MAFPTPVMCGGIKLLRLRRLDVGSQHAVAPSTLFGRL